MTECRDAIFCVSTFVLINNRLFVSRWKQLSSRIDLTKINTPIFLIISLLKQKEYDF